MNTECYATFLRDAIWIIQKRNVRLCDIFSSNRSDWLAVLADGYMTISGCQREIRSFDELESLQKEFALPSLGDIRAQGLLVEGERVLPRGLIDILVEFSNGTVRVRTSGENFPKMMSADGFSTMVSSDVNDDEFEATGANDAWYLRMRNDDALVFIAASHFVAEKIIASFPANVRPVPDDFLFSF